MTFIGFNAENNRIYILNNYEKQEDAFQALCDFNESDGDYLTVIPVPVNYGITDITDDLTK